MDFITKGISHWVTFRIGAKFCALTMRKVGEILPMASLVCPPGMPKLLDGILILSGKAIPVIPLARLFGLPMELPGA